MNDGVKILKDSLANQGQTGRLKVGTSPVQIDGPSSLRHSGIHLRASGNNTGIIYVGFLKAVTSDGDDVTSGFPLNANDGLFIPVEFISEIWLIADASDQKIFWLSK